MKPFKCENGKIYMAPDQHCIFCKHCTDIFYDYTHGPYMFPCNKGHENFKTCNSFEGEDDEKMTVYEFLKAMHNFSKYDKWNIREKMTDITKDEPICFNDVKYEERENVLNALEYQVLTVDMAEGTIYCER